MMLVLRLGQPLTQSPCLVIVDIGQRRDAEAVGLAVTIAQLLARLDAAQDVAQRLRTAGIAVRSRVLIERVGKIDRAAVIKDLQTGSFDTMIGKVKLENNMPTRYWWVGQWQDGEFYGIAPAGNEGARKAIVPKPAWVTP